MIRSAVKLRPYGSSGDFARNRHSPRLEGGDFARNRPIHLPRAIKAHYDRAIAAGRGGDNWTRLIDGIRNPR
ncbi:hypothetical protein [Saccharopolyspora sp. ASAGF58]|uniref:imine reductase family protein n=1 Tax=Saccharopolyspora sp. ASAGF58 TaxID=2719023 RepID=UPI001B30FAB7|nr:hypothetical protein [Saccharopolyspora sp. ASAGF58]